MSIITEELCHALELIITASFFCRILSPRIKPIYTYFFWLADIAVTTAITFPYRGVSVQRGPVVIAGILIGVLTVYRDKWYKKLFGLVQMLALIFLSELLCLFTYRLMSGSWTVSYNSVERQLCSILLVVFYSFFAAVAIGINKKTDFKGFKWIFITQLLLTVSQTVYLYIIYTANKNLSDNALFLLMAAAITPAVLVNLFLTNAIDISAKIEIKKRELEFAESMNRREYTYYLTAIENEQKLSELRHDMSNMLQTALALSESGETDKGKQLLNEFNSIKKSAETVKYCDNAIFNIVLAVKRKEFEEKGISCRFSIDSPLNKIPLTDMEASSVLSNLLDNAERAALESEKKEITLLAGEKQGYLVIRCENSCPEKTENGVFGKTDKKEKHLHGFGVGIIRRIVSSHGGELVGEKNGDRVTVTATFQL